MMAGYYLYVGDGAYHKFSGRFKEFPLIFAFGNSLTELIEDAQQRLCEISADCAKSSTAMPDVEKPENGGIFISTETDDIYIFENVTKDLSDGDTP